MAQLGNQESNTRVSAPAEPLISHRPDNCVECWGCVRHCPARAIRVVDGRTEVIEERCVKCGQCVTECGNSGHIVRDDLSRVRTLIESDRPVVVLLASEYIAALHPIPPTAVEPRLKAIGFAAVETTVLGEELVATSYEQRHSRNGSYLPRFRSTCPVTAEWIRRFYPQLVEALVPVVPPYIAQARLVREVYPEDVAVVYVSPCWSRKDEIYERALAGAVDVAIGFDELRGLLDECTRSGAPSPGRQAQAVKQLSVTDGFPRRTLKERDLTDREVAIVRGLSEVDRLCSAIVRGETAPEVVDMLNCEGCIDGPCVNREMSVFAKRGIDSAERERQAPPPIDSRTFLSALPAIDMHRGFTACPAPVREATAEEIDIVLQAGEFASRDTTIDCGACGYSTCAGHALAIWEGNSSWEMCFPLQRRRLLREREQFATAAAVDGLTGLMNRRGFEQRLTEEVARAQRYGLPLSLVLIDLDEFKDINDTYGHHGGDQVLRGVSVLLSSELRAMDVAVRYGGDEFAVLLPNTNKTDAWAVAEKIRYSLAELQVEVEDDKFVTTTSSLGVAGLTPRMEHADDLVEAADHALYAAKHAGRDRVELASG